MTKRAGSDTCLSVAFLSTRVRAPNRDDWEKLRHLVGYLRKDNTRPLVLGADNDGLLIWYVDASFTVYPNMCGHRHSGGGLTHGRGFPILASTKQKLNTKSSTECELVGVDDMMPHLDSLLPFFTGLWNHQDSTVARQQECNRP